MKKKINDLLLKMQIGESCIGVTANELLNLCNVMDRLPDVTVIRDNAKEMDEKEFEHWWWETVYKVN